MNCERMVCNKLHDMNMMYSTYGVCIWYLYNMRVHGRQQEEEVEKNAFVMCVI